MVFPVLQVPGFEHVNDQPQKPVIVDLLRQDPDHDVMAQGPEAVRNISLDEPYSTGPGALDFAQSGMTPPPFPESVRPVTELPPPLFPPPHPPHSAAPSIC